MVNKTSHTLQSRQRSAGFTLLEVAVALAIFVIGALAIIQIFPPALGVIRNSENRTTGTLLAQGTTEKLRRDTNLIPDAIFDAVYNAGTSTWDRIDFNGATVGTVNTNASLPQGPGDPAFANSALSRFRYIRGERHTVQGPTGGLPFVITQFPYASPATSPVTVYIEDKVNGVRVDSAGNLDFSDARLASTESPFFDVSPPAGATWPPPPDDVLPNSLWRTNTTYYVSYRWRSAAGQILGGVVDEAVKFPPDTNWSAGVSGRVLQGTVTLPAGKSIVSGPVNVRLMRQVATPTLPVAVPTDANMRGYLPLTGFTAGTRVLVDYQVADWRWLVDDRMPSQVPANDPPNSTNRAVPLPLRSIDSELPVPLYGMLIRPSTSNVNFTQPASSNVNYKTGQVIYDLGPPTPPDIKPEAQYARTVYRTLDGWAHQLSVAARSYVPYYAATEFTGGTRPTAFPRDYWREYVWSSAAGSGNLYFHPSEAGKSIAVSFQYNDGGVLRTVTDSIVTIKDDIIPPPTAVGWPAGFVGTSGRVAWAELAGLKGEPVTTNVTAILSLCGVGVQARSAWLNGDRYSQTVVTDHRLVEQS